MVSLPLNRFHGPSLSSFESRTYPSLHVEIGCSKSVSTWRRPSLTHCSAQLQRGSTSDVQDVVIIGGGIAGMATALAFHRLGIKSTVLEQSPTLRVAGTALAVWTNGWRALDALGLADDLRGNFLPLYGFQFYSTEDKCISDLSFSSGNKHVELRGVDRRMLLEALVDALPMGTISYDSRATSLIKGDGQYTQVVLKNGSKMQAKVVIGCDGIGSIVAKDLGFEAAHYAGYVGIRGLAMYPDGHEFPRVLKQVLGRGVRMGCLPLDSNRLYWFLVFNHPPGTKVSDPSLIKQEALQLIQGWPDAVVDAIRRSPLETLSRSAISDRWMWPWQVSKLHRYGITVAGDAMHPVTPNLAQGGCSALEDGVVVARVLSKAMKGMEGQNFPYGEEMRTIEGALDEYSTQRQKRMFEVAVEANLIGRMLQVEGELCCTIRDALLSRVVPVDSYTKHSLFDVGALA